MKPRPGFVLALAIAFSVPIAVAVVIVAGHDSRAAVRVAQVGAASEAAPRPQLPPRRFDGSTGQRKPIAFRLSADGRQIEHLWVSYVATCNESISMELDDELYSPIAVRANGSFEQRLGNRIVVSGTIEGDRATGTFTVDMNYGIFTCRSPAVRWDAGTPRRPH